MYEIKENRRKIHGMDVTTFTREIYSANVQKRNSSVISNHLVDVSVLRVEHEQCIKLTWVFVVARYPVTFIFLSSVGTDYTAIPLLHDIFKEGKLVYKQPSLDEIKKFCADNLDGLWDEYKRSLNPQEYPVDLSQNLYESKMNLIQDIRRKIRERSIGR